MKKIKNNLKIIVFSMIIILFGISHVYAATNPYNEKGPYGTNCTWYAWKMAYEKAGVTLPGWGNAKNWYQDALDDGYSVGDTPKANSIIVWSNWTSYGHVGYVERVEENILHVWDSTGPCIDEEDPEYRDCMANGVSEESDKICKANAKRIACVYTISPSDYEITGYIYLDETPKKPESKPQNTETTSKTDDTSTNEETKKSNNANLSSIEITNGNLEFDKTILNYEVEVENEVDKITIKATPEETHAKIKGVGDYDLNVGLNEIKLVVTAEDNTTKEYTIKVTRIEEKMLDLDTNKEENTITNDSDDNSKTMFLVLSICFLTILIICVIYIIKRKNKVKSNKLKS